MNAPHDYPSLRPREQSPTLGRAPGVRLLPVLMFVAVGVLGFRIEVVVQSIANARNASLQVGTQTAQAQTAPEKTGEKGGEKIAANAEKPVEGEAKESDAEPMADAEADADEEEKVPPGTLDPKTLTKSEIETLQRLAERRDGIEKRERDQDAREGLLKAGESRIDGKIAELHDLQKTIEGLLQKYDQQKQAEIESLVKIYGAMKPKDAAAIFDGLDMPILLAVVQNMKEQKAGVIMALMNRDKAKALTEEMSQRKQIGLATE